MSFRVPALRTSFRLCSRPKALQAGPSHLPYLPAAPRRLITASEKPLPKADQKGPGPNQEQLPHVSEEAAATAKITGEGGPELEQGTPVQEVLKRDDEGQQKAPEVLKENVSKSSPSGTRSFSTYARRYAELVYQRPSELSSDQSQQDIGALLFGDSDPSANDGHLFGLPQVPLAKNMHLKHRENELIEQMTRLIMQSGKLSRAQSMMAMILERLRTAKPPIYSTTRPPLPGSPPASHLPLNPVLYLTIAIDSLAPLLRLKSLKGMAGGGAAMPLPVSMSKHQRRRTAIMWILEAASKKKSMGSGRGMFAHKVADEIIAVVEGRSGTWEKRIAVHRLATAARANMSALSGRKKIR